jgi:pimeloyl-ACP methyl ester carboxylesterase
LSKLGKVIALDLSGFVLSERSLNDVDGINPYSRKGKAEVLKAFIEKFDFNNVVLVGNSMSGSIEFNYTSRYPNGLNVLVF